MYHVYLLSSLLVLIFLVPQLELLLVSFLIVPDLFSVIQANQADQDAANNVEMLLTLCHTNFSSKW